MSKMTKVRGNKFQLLAEMREEENESSADVTLMREDSNDDWGGFNFGEVRDFTEIEARIGIWGDEVSEVKGMTNRLSLALMELKEDIEREEDDFGSELDEGTNVETNDIFRERITRSKNDSNGTHSDDKDASSDEGAEQQHGRCAEEDLPHDRAAGGRGACYRKDRQEDPGCRGQDRRQQGRDRPQRRLRWDWSQDNGQTGPEDRGEVREAGQDGLVHAHPAHHGHGDVDHCDPHEQGLEEVYSSVFDLCDFVLCKGLNPVDFCIWRDYAKHVVESLPASFRIKDESLESESGGKASTGGLSTKEKEIGQKIWETLKLLDDREAEKDEQDDVSQAAEGETFKLVGSSRRKRVGKTQQASSKERKKSSHSLYKAVSAGRPQERTSGRLPAKVLGKSRRHAVSRDVAVVNPTNVVRAEMYDGDHKSQRQTGEAALRVARPSQGVRRGLGARQSDVPRWEDQEHRHQEEEVRKRALIWAEWDRYEEEKRNLMNANINCNFTNDIVYQTESKDIDDLSLDHTNDDISECFSLDLEMGKTPSVCSVCNLQFGSITEMKAHRIETHKGVDLKKSLPTKLKARTASASRSPARKKVVNSAPGSPEVMNQWLAGQTNSNKVGDLLAQGRQVMPTRPASNPGPQAVAAADGNQAQVKNPEMRLVTLFPPVPKKKKDLSSVETRWKDALLGKKPGSPVGPGANDNPELEEVSTQEAPTQEAPDTEPEKHEVEPEPEKRKRAAEEGSVEGEADLKAADVKATPPEMKLHEADIPRLVATSRNLDAALAEVADTMELTESEEWGSVWTQDSNIESGPLAETSNKIDFTSFSAADQEAWEAERRQLIGNGNRNVPLSPVNDLDNLYSKIEAANSSNRELTDKLKEVICDKEELYNIVTELEDKLAVSQSNLEGAKTDLKSLTGQHKSQIEAAEKAVQTERQKEEAEIRKLTFDLKQTEARVKRGQSDLKDILTQHSDARVEIAKLNGEVKAERLKTAEGAKTIARLELFVRNAQEDRVHKDQQIAGLEHRLKALTKKLPCDIVNCGGRCDKEHHCGEHLEEIPRSPVAAAAPTMENLAAQTNLSLEQIMSIVKLAKMAPGVNNGGGGGGGFNNRSRKTSRKPRPGYIVERCKFYFNPEIGVCPYGEECWNSHQEVSLVSAQDAARANRQGQGQEAQRTFSESRVPKVSSKFTPAYHPSHPNYRANSAQQPAGNERGQMSGATSVQNQRPRHSSESVTSEEAARIRVADSIAQRRTDKSQIAATQDAEYIRILKAAEATMQRSIFGANQNPDNSTGQDMA